MGGFTIICKHGISKTFDTIPLQQTKVSVFSSLFTVNTIVACTCIFVLVFSNCFCLVSDQ